MSFLWIRMLWMLILIPVLVIAYIWIQRRRQKFALRYASLSLVKEALGRGPGIRRHIPAVLFLLGLAVMIFALARPMTTVLLPSQKSTVILTIDVSGSMRADDMNPNRMEAAKTAARAFVEKQPADVSIGVVSFSGGAALVQAPTKKREDVIAAIDRLRTQRGTAVGYGILASVNAVFEGTSMELPDFPTSRGFSFQPDDSAERTIDPVEPGTYAQAVVVLLSDGQSNQGPDPMEMADYAADLGVRIYTVGMGSSEGVILGFMGRSMRVQLDEESLRNIADKTDAEYFKAGSETELKEVYETLSANLVLEREQTEITVLFTGLAVVILLVAGVISMLWFHRFL